RGTIVGRFLDYEIVRRSALWTQLGGDSGVSGLERRFRDLRPIATNGGCEIGYTTFVEGIVDPIDPLHVGTEPRAPVEIERDVDAEAAGHRDRIDEMAERGGTGEHEIMAAGVMGGRNSILGNSGDRASERLRAQAGGIHHGGATDRDRIVAADLQLDP